jgi:hypothetical protein
VNLAGDKVDAGQQGDCAVALVFMVAGEGRMNAGLGRQIGGRRRNRLNTGLFVVGDNRHPVVRLPLQPRRRLLEQFHFAIDAKHLGHFLRELRITLLQVVTDLHFLRIEHLAQCALRQVRQAGVPFGGTVLASVPGEQPRRPQFMRITQILSPSGTKAMSTRLSLPA